MSLFGDAPAELIYNMSGVGNAVTANSTVSPLAAGGPLMGGGPTAGVASLIPPCEIPHNYFSKVGKALLVEGFGVYGIGSTIPTLKIGMFIDTVVGTATATPLAATGAFTATDITSGRTTMGFNFKVAVTCTAVGTSGTLQAWGWLNWGMLSSALTVTSPVPQITYYMGAGTTAPYAINTAQSTPMYLEPYAYWSSSSTGPSITLTQMYVWGLN